MKFSVETREYRIAGRIFEFHVQVQVHDKEEIGPSLYPPQNRQVTST